MLFGLHQRQHGVVQYTAWFIEESAKGNPFTIWVRPDMRVPLLNFKDAALATVAQAEAPAERITMVNDLLGGPSPGAQELVDLIREKLTDSEITFDVNEEIQALLDNAIHPIDDRFARNEWGWEPIYDLNAMVEDFISELSQNPERTWRAPVRLHVRSRRMIRGAELTMWFTLPVRRF